MKPLHIKEHTAQLGREEQQEYQEMFVKKDINLFIIVLIGIMINI